MQGQKERNLTVLADGFSFLEGPRWHEGHLWASDFYTNRVVKVDLAGKSEEAFEVPGQPSGLGWLPNGDTLVVSMLEKKIMRWNGLELTVHADLSHVAESVLNDMVVDDQGRAYVGNTGVDLLAGEAIGSPATLIRVDPDGSITKVAPGLGAPNGMSITADGKTMYVSESTANRVLKFNIDPDGSLSQKEIYYSDGDLPTSNDNLIGMIGSGEIRWLPDGMCIDAEGAIWVSDGIGSRVLRIKDGLVVEEINTKDMGLLVPACALGGDDGRTLFLMAVPDFRPEVCKANRDASILTTRVEIPRAGKP
ncbi:gluconolactonase [Paenarthrobacter nitroguajacolicus]|uniref:SMP-30/gluconolactonase/LRE family protein n=1 Tax=Paenarthrobacter nitroguajacolicus TaxID=211146 RepID=UPI0015BF55D2|nr:SMP-30/gluconolactonase/LRE family protein [Paenarthrobacter nitroguajacolicus]NWL10292.1 gluconolactonase [Paenarthrobacter nitroguajacolicus]